ncbi:Peptidase M28 [Penicillium robsamsonii]|uniref:Peptidase M28 n=1 Tax=Penicillium robsamsonii TaxID=1792511 RepID=UPI002547A9DD|nr:Peptidase M28 [Penicillium robsamsonii]KAJ5824165.1 Peptidase M28 [Penicillium robsamsonii]
MSSAYRITPGIVSFWLGLLLMLLSCVDAYEELSDKTLIGLLRPNNDFDINNGALLSPILRTRVPGTPGSTAVLNHFADFFRTTLPKWTIEVHNSTSKTPLSKGKDVPFRNFIATRDPPWASVGDVGRLTLVAHYDSKIEPEGFIGGIDSAAPCAIIMHAMRSVDAALEKKWSALKEQGLNDYLEEERGLQIIFLDGEEAFKHWSDADSLYGARALATHWGDQVYPAMSEFKSPLSSISLFVLLDLLGSKSPTIHSYYETTHWAYQRLGAIEKRFRSLKQFKSASADPWFVDTAKDGHKLASMGGIQDDHLPFLAKGVEILHLIDFAPFKGFPPVWHTIDDDGEHLDLDTVEDWSMLVTAFAAEWMELEGYFSHSSVHGPRSDDEPAELEALRMSRKTEL